MPFPYKELPPREARTFIESLNDNQLNPGLNPETTKVLSQTLSFAQSWKRMECEDYSEIPHIKRKFLSNDNTIMPLLYGPEPQKDVLSILPLNLTAENVIDYLTLYFSLLLQNGERILPVYHSDDIEWQDDLPPMLKKSLDKDLSKYPVVVETNDGYEINLLCLFRQSLLKMTCLVMQDGSVEIKNHTVHTEDLPVH